MKKYLIIIALVIAVGAPNAYAQFDYTCNPPCSQGMYCNSDRTCVSISQTLTQQPTSGGININYIKPYSDSIIGIINSILVPVLIAIAFIVFLWGVYKYFIYHGDSESDKMEGRKYAMWGIIGLRCGESSASSSYSPSGRW